VDVPGRIGHDHLELAEHVHVEGAQVALHPLRRVVLQQHCVVDRLRVQGDLLVDVEHVHLVVDVLAVVDVVAGVEEGAVAERGVGVGLEDALEVDLVALLVQDVLVVVVAEAFFFRAVRAVLLDVAFY